MSVAPIILDQDGQRYCLRALLTAQVRYRRLAPAGPYAVTTMDGSRELGELQPEIPAAAAAPDEGVGIIYADGDRQTRLWAVGVPEVPE